MKKTIIITALVAVLAFAGSASAQQYSPVTVYSQGTNAIAGSATVTPGSVITMTKSNNVAFQIFATSLAGSTNAVTANFAKSVDGVTYETTPSVTLAVTANGTNAVSALTNVATGAVGYLKLTSIVNGNTNALTGVGVTAAKKPGN